MMDMFNATVAPDNTHIRDSYLVRSREAMRIYLTNLREFYGDGTAVSRRDLESQVREWRTHNFFYKLHVFRSRTKDVDLELEQHWWRELFCRAIDFIYFWDGVLVKMKKR